MKSNRESIKQQSVQLTTTEQEIKNLLDASARALPAAVSRRLTAARHAGLEQLMARPSHTTAALPAWRPAFAVLALGLIAGGLLFLPARQHQPEAYTWAFTDESLLGDDLSLHLWLTDDIDTGTGE